jgi:hypothetical protein
MCVVREMIYRGSGHYDYFPLRRCSKFKSWLGRREGRGQKVRDVVWVDGECDECKDERYV